MLVPKPAEVAEGATKQEDVMPNSLEEIQELIADSAEFRTAYLADPEKYEGHIAGIEAAGGTVPPQGVGSQGTVEEPPVAPVVPPQGTQPDPGAAAPSTPEEMITVTVDGEVVEIPKSQLGTYGANGRTGAQSLVEAMKGMKSKDDLIGFYKEKDATSEAEKGTLKSRIAQFQAGKGQPPPADAAAAAPAASSELAEVTEIDLDAISALESDEDALLDPDKRKTVFSTIRDLAKNVNAVQANLAATNKQTAESQTQSQQADIAKAARDAANQERTNELTEIAQLMGTEPALKTSKDFIAVDADVHQWMRNVGSVAGTGGNWDQKTFDAVALYQSGTPEGEALKARVEGNGVFPPQDLGRHTAIMEIRKARNVYKDTLRQNMATQLGKDASEIADHELPAIPFTYTDLYQRERTRNGNFAKDVLDATVEAQKNLAAASAGGDTAAEIPPEASVAPMSLASISEAKLGELLRMDSQNYSPQEAQVVLEYFKAEDITPPPVLVQKAAQAAAGG